MKKNIKYNPQKYISVLEINPFKISLISGLEIFLLKNKNELSRFEVDYYDSIFNFENKNCISDNLVKQIISKIRDAFQKLNRRNSQAFSIIITGFNRLKDQELLKKLIIAEIKKTNVIPYLIKIDFLTPKLESYYSFLALVKTTNEKEEYSKNFPSNLDFYRCTCGHFYLDTNQTIFTEFQGEDFNLTRSLPLSLNSIALELENENHKMTKDDLYSLIPKLKINFINELKKIDTNKKINIWIFSGGEDTRFNFYKPNFRSYNAVHNLDLNKYKNNTISPKIISIINDLLLNKNNHSLFKTYVFHIFMQAFYHSFHANNVSYNHANVKVGYYYNLIEKLASSY